MVILKNKTYGIWSFHWPPRHGRFLGINRIPKLGSFYIFSYYVCFDFNETHWLFPKYYFATFFKNIFFGPPGGGLRGSLSNPNFTEIWYCEIVVLKMVNIMHILLVLFRSNIGMLLVFLSPLYVTCSDFYYSSWKNLLIQPFGVIRMGELRWLFLCIFF